MASALETLIKILRLEQDTGYKNTAVIGGLHSYIPNWSREAHQQAKTPVQHNLIEELGKVMTEYSTLEDRDKRQQSVKYMMGRITGRVQPDPAYAAEWVAPNAPETPPPAKTAPAARIEPAASPPPKPPTPRPAPPPRQPQRPPPKPKFDDGDDDDDDGDTGGGRFRDDIIKSSLEVMEFVAPNILDRKSQTRAPKPRRTPRKSTEIEAAREVMGHLNDRVQNLKGVGDKRAEQLARLGVATLGDMLFFMPRRYDDYTRLLPLSHLKPYQQTAAIGTIQRVTELKSREGRPFLSVSVEDGAGKINVTFFNQPFLKRMLKVGMQIALYGKTDLFRGDLSMSNPEWELVDQRSLQQGGIVPVYPLTQGLSSKIVRKLMREVLDTWSNKLPDYMPESVLERTEMVDLGWALRQIHMPQKWEFLEYAQERLAFDELMLLQLGILAKRQLWQSVPGIPLTVTDEWAQAFVSGLPYQLTGAQQKAIEAIRQDLTQAIPMNRLLQGDVGSGKTVVAAMALGMAIANGKQSALMAPTSILAEQHYQGIRKLFAGVSGGEKVNIQLLTGSTPEPQRREIYEGLANGSVQVVIGTHALIQQGIEFNDLALAIIDEQHRFGVDERGALRGKGVNPHVLVMTATPIPRTLALTMYADLDLTVLDEMPPGRQPIETKLLFAPERERAYSFIKHQLEEGRQAFIIYPLVEAAEDNEGRSAVEAFEELSTTIFRHYRCGLMHGRLKPAEKDEVMAAVANGEIQVLISTSVIEVGIDVPNATVILIEGANRFGLAQLHQFRGRVGRGQYQSYCLLISDSDNPEAVERLRKFEALTDGFELAELDWQLRGPGDLLGTRQAGYGAVRFDQSMDVRLVELAQKESKAIYAEDPLLTMPEHQLLARRVRLLQERQTDLS